MSKKLQHFTPLLILLLFSSLYSATPVDPSTDSSIKECLRLFDEGTYQQAIPSCTKAAESNDLPSQAMLGEIYDQQENSEQAAHWWNKAATSGYQPARNQLALKYYYGGTVFGLQKGWEKDQEKAFKIWREDAEQNIASSQFMIGVMYQKGEGVEKDLSETWYWLKRALGNGYKLATDVLIEVSREITAQQKQLAEQKLLAYQKGQRDQKDKANTSI